MTLDEAEALRHELTAEFEPARAMHLVQKRIDEEQLNGFLRSILDRPLRELQQIFTTREPLLVGAAQRGHGLEAAAIPAMHAAALPTIRAMIAHGADDIAEPNVSIGYSALAKNNYRLEVRLQRPNVAAILFAQDVVQRAGGQASIAEYRDLKTHAGPRVASAAPTLAIGNSIGHPKAQAGTLGLFMRSPEGIGVLSNSHILARCGRARRGDAIYAPHPSDRGDSLKIAQLLKFSSLIQEDVIHFDAAFATLNDGIPYAGNMIPKGMPEGGKKVVAARKKPDPGGLKVSKIGRSSGHTTGIFSAVGVDPTLEYAGVGDVKLTGMLEIVWDTPDKAFSEPGDSGSVVYRPDTMEAIAIVVGGGIRVVDGVPEGVSIACPLDQLMTEWDLSLL